MEKWVVLFFFLQSLFNPLLGCEKRKGRVERKHVRKKEKRNMMNDNIWLKRNRMK